MCRADLQPQAQEAVAHLLLNIAQSIADQATVDVSSVRIGPVDLRSTDKSELTA
jgi:hypothetical protein